MSLLGFSGAIAILAPYGVQQLSFTAAVTAAVVGSVLGGLILGASLVLGARTGAPAMVLLRGLLGAKASFVPTALNIAQCLGWAVFELVTITIGLQALTHGDLPRWLCLVLAGAVTTALTIRPLGWIRALRKYVSVLVVLALVVLAVGLLRQPVPELAGSWQGFWLAVDSAMALTISWVPLGADYSRHSRSARAAFAGGFLGYGLTQIACLVIGLIALAQVAQDGERIFDLFIGLPLGTLAFAILVIRESDQSFANVYSTAISLQNLRPSLDRRVLTVLIGTLTTALALTINIDDYANFLYLIGGVFIPMSGALIAAWIRSRGRGLEHRRRRPGAARHAAGLAGGFLLLPADQSRLDRALVGLLDLGRQPAAHPGPPLAVGLDRLVRGGGAGGAAVRRSPPRLPGRAGGRRREPAMSGPAGGDELVIAGRRLSSRLIVGTGGAPSLDGPGRHPARRPAPS